MSNIAGAPSQRPASATPVSSGHDIPAADTIHEVPVATKLWCTIVMIILLGIGCFLGGYIAPPITRHIPAKVMRYAAVAAGIILAGNLAMQTYL